ncbi:MAG TPA: lactate permease, partial [Thermodesulfobacterium commune]|nr:lactate permease [Thermodesulfobacterium commune]
QFIFYSPILTIGIILGFAYLMNYSGMAITLGLAFASTGFLFPLFSAFLGWLGVFMTGSDTSTNALFGKLQEVTARQIGIDPVLTVATNSSGGVMGKMISPQSIAVATAATGLSGKEGDIFRFTFKHSVILTFLMGILAMLQAYVFTWMIPVWEKAVETAKAASAAQAAVQEGYNILIATFVASILLVIISRIVGKGANYVK